MLSVRKATIEDIDTIMNIYASAREFMKKTGNPDQWGSSYPPRALIEEDIRSGICRAVCDESGIHGVFALLEEADPSYEYIENGAWPDDGPYVTIHRIAGDGKVRGVFACAAGYCKQYARNVRIDTHARNVVMQRHIESNGFEKCGTVYLANGSPRIAYQWTAEPENEYVKNLYRIEFVVTLACTGKCKHCQNGAPVRTSEHIAPRDAERAIRSVCAHYPIRSVLTFGGESLLYPETVCAVHKTASECGVPVRQVITNGFFSSDRARMESVAKALCESGVNDLRISADAFHQETIPLGPVMYFAGCAVKYGVPVSLQPSWLVSREDENPYNLRTKEVLQAFASLHLPVCPGDVIFPCGNALKYLNEYFDPEKAGYSPYEEDPADVRSLSFLPNGDVLNGNVHNADILDIIKDYRP